MAPTASEMNIDAPTAQIPGTATDQVVLRHESEGRDLPVEILLIIFKIVFYEQSTWSWSSWRQFSKLSRHGKPGDSCRGPGCSCRFSPDIWDAIQDVRNPRWFPYSLSRVCPHWDSVMAREPEFWTRPIVFLDTKRYDPVARLQIELGRARGLPISIYVDRLDQTLTAATAGLENGRLQRLSDVLSNLPKGVYRAHICGPDNVQLARALEALCTGQRLGKLRDLTLGSDPRCENAPPLLSLPLASRPSFDSLKNLHLSGLAILLARSSIFKARDLSLSYLTISNISSTHRHHLQIDIPDVIAIITNFESVAYGLTLCDIDLPGDFDGERLEMLGTPSTFEDVLGLSFTRVCAPLIDAVMGAFFPSEGHLMDDLWFDDCPLDQCSTRFPRCMATYLTDINNPMALFLYFHLANTQTLVLKNCASLDDHALSPLSKRGSRDSELPCMSRLHALNIKGCPVSFAGLKKLITDRRRNAKAAGVPFDVADPDEFEPWSYENPPITELLLARSFKQHFSEAERLWLESNVTKVVWI